MEAYFLLKRLTSLWKNIELEPGTAMETYIYILHTIHKCLPSWKIFPASHPFNLRVCKMNFPVWSEIQYVIVVWKERNKNHALKNSMPKQKKWWRFYLEFKEGLPRWGRQHFKWCLNCCKTNVAFQRANTNTSLPLFFRKITCKKFKSHGKNANLSKHWGTGQNPAVCLWLVNLPTPIPSLKPEIKV